MARCLASVLVRFLARFLVRLFEPENIMYSFTGTEKYCVQYYPDRENKLLTICESKSTNPTLYSMYPIVIYRV